MKYKNLKEILNIFHHYLAVVWNINEGDLFCTITVYNIYCIVNETII